MENKNSPSTPKGRGSLYLNPVIKKMGNKSSPSTPKGRASLFTNLENSSSNRKPLTQITNICNQSPGIPKSNEKQKNIIDYSKENLSPFLSKSSVHNFGKRVSTSHSSIHSSVELSQQNQSLSSTASTSTSTPLSDMNRYSSTPRSTSEQCTPKTFIPYNPFEVKAELLQLPTVSPSLFKEVVSPSEKEDTTFSWSINNLAILRPAPIDTPGSDMEVPIDPEYERKAQEAIDKFFSRTQIVPSPWTDGSSKSISVMSAIFSSAGKKDELSSASPALICSTREIKNDGATLVDASYTPTKVSTVCCQTELSLPPVLPKEIESVLAPYFTFTQDISPLQNSDEIEDSSVLNTTSLRRKLLFSDESLSIQQSSGSLSRVSSKIAKEKVDVDASSPISTGPLPLEDDEILPWSVSMIRPSSRSSSHYPLPSSLRSSAERKYSGGSDIYAGDKSHVVVTPKLSPNGISPIAYFPPNDLRSIPSPLEGQQTPSRRVLSSPKLSPILNLSLDQTIKLKTPSPYSSFGTKLSSEITRSPLEYPRGKRGRNTSKLLTSPALESRSFENKNNMENSDCQEFLINEERSPLNIVETDSDSQGFIIGSASRSGGKLVENIKTPVIRENRRLMFKTSPHFSSSPIKGSNVCDSSCSPYKLDINKLDDKEDNCSSKLSDSPPLSPISWKSDTEGSCDMNLKQQSPHEHNYSSENMEGESGTSVLPGIKDSSSCPKYKNKEENISTVVLDEGLGHTQEIIMSNLTSADTEFPNLHEGSTVEDISCGQDTGYQTGSSLQINSANQSMSLTSSGVINYKDTKGINSEIQKISVTKVSLVDNVCNENEKVFCTPSTH